MHVCPIHDDSRVVLVASKGGDDRDPQWNRSPTANPDMELVIDGASRKMRARTAPPEEKAALWPDIVAADKYFDSYQKRADRDIPVVICEPRPGLTFRVSGLGGGAGRYDQANVDGAHGLAG
jgi:deazaflavin-dependent oxidoreductase (nitroreductase family)